MSLLTTSCLRHKICVIKMRGSRQLTLPEHGGWGGRRKGAGRKPKGQRSGVSHARRPVLARRFPVHVTLRVLPHVWNLRSRRGFRVVQRALAAAANRFGLRICEFSVQGNHLHLIVEAEDVGSLSRGMQGFSIRLARGLNGMMARSGKVLADRFHGRILRTPTEVFRVFNYVRQNRAIHRARWGRLTARHCHPTTHVDLCSSAAPNHGVPLPNPVTYLLLRVRAQACRHPDAYSVERSLRPFASSSHRTHPAAETTPTLHASPLLFAGNPKWASP
jgi:putative transposase